VPPADIFFISGTNPTASASFDATQYKLSQIANVTITDSTASGTVPVIVNSTSDGVGIHLTLNETGHGTGIFKGSLSFTSGSSSGTALKANAGDALKVNYNGVTASASIYSRTQRCAGQFHG
jgi:hypothetical protein